MMAGRPAIYATFSSYDEVAHHSGLERSDTLEALRKLDKQFGRIERARKYAPRPYEIVVLSDHGQTQGATFLQRNGYTLHDLVSRSLESGAVTGIADGDESATMVGTAFGEATGRSGTGRAVAGGGPRGGRARLGQSRPDLPARRPAPDDARGDQRAPPAADRRAACAPARRLAARPQRAGRRARAGRNGLRPAPRRPRRGRRPAGAVRARRRRITWRAPTASRTWRTSWSAASTTPSSRRGARSRS